MLDQTAKNEEKTFLGKIDDNDNRISVFCPIKLYFLLTIHTITHNCHISQCFTYTICRLPHVSVETVKSPVTRCFYCIYHEYT